MKIFETFEKIGVKATLAFVLLLIGFAVATNQELKNGLDLALPADQKALMGGSLVVVGMILALAAIYDTQKGSSEFAARKNAFQTIEKHIDEHRALKGEDSPEFVSRHYESAQGLREKLHALHVDEKMHQAGRDLANQLAKAAADFLSEIEPIELGMHVDLANENVMLQELARDEQQAYVGALHRWRQRTAGLLDGVRIMLTTPA